MKNGKQNKMIWKKGDKLFDTVQPLSPPTGKLYYMDFKYEDILEKRRLKLDKIINKLNEYLDN